MSSQRSSVYQTGNSIIQQRKLDPLGFGGSDALWDTIAKSQGSSDVTVEKIISNFLRRGGSPNTAKQSATSHAVKYGYARSESECHLTRSNGGRQGKGRVEERM
ncbi:hypothetical protein G6F68_018613 [Rhizopus microsporus]|nr:hypothetical protein G6F68_018613 [Rhizopus microsporus]